MTQINTNGSATQYPYNYTILRYVHDTLTQEFVNIGVIIFSYELKKLSFSFIKPNNKNEYTRIKNMFPDVNNYFISMLLYSINSSVEKIQLKLSNLNTQKNFEDFYTVITNILPKDDSSLQCSQLGCGLTKDFTSTLEILFERFINRYHHIETYRNG